MNATETAKTDPAQKDFKKSWRYKVGLFLIIVGNVGVILSVTVLPFLGLNIAIIGALALGSEIMATTSIVVLGVKGFKEIKNKITGAVKASYTKAVSRTRHRIGITLFLLSFLNNYFFAAYAWVVFGKTTPENPFPGVFGLNFQDQQELLLWAFLAGEAFFLISIYVLGAEWWGRFRNIFVWKGEKE